MTRFFHWFSLLAAPFFHSTEKKMSISPGGLFGFYNLGVAAYIKEHYNLSDYRFSGTSAGSWVALFLTAKTNTTEMTENILRNVNERRPKSVYHVEMILRDVLLSQYKTADFDLDRLSISMTTLTPLISKTVYSHFSSLEDAVNASIASSHIPYITGGLCTQYRNVYSLDGVFSGDMGIHFADDATTTTDTSSATTDNNSLFSISPFMWKNNTSRCSSLMKFTHLFSLNKINISQLFYEGYADTMRNDPQLQKTFNPLSPQ